MANAIFVKSAQKNIYENGKYVKYKSLKGKRAGQELEKLDRTVPKNDSDKIFIAKGESYYWWAFKNGGKHFSKEQPRSSQLTQSNYLSQLYAIQERVEDFTAEVAEDIEPFVDEIKSDLESLKEETEGSLENMPESLQSSPTGELLQERIDALDNAISELESIQVDDYEEPTDEEIKDDLGEDATEEDIEEEKKNHLQEWIDEKVNEIQGVSFE